MVTTRRLVSLAAVIAAGSVALLPLRAGAATVGTVTAGPKVMTAGGYVAPGDWIAAGYAVSITVRHGADTVHLTGVTATIPVVCWFGGAATITVHFADSRLTIPAGDGNPYPSGRPDAAASYQASTQAPDACHGAPMFLGRTDATGASYAATVLASDVRIPLTIQFHAVDGTSMRQSLAWAAGVPAPTGPTAPSWFPQGSTGSGFFGAGSTTTSGAWPAATTAPALNCSLVAQNPAGGPACAAAWTPASTTYAMPDSASSGGTSGQGSTGGGSGPSTPTLPGPGQLPGGGVPGGAGAGPAGTGHPTGPAPVHGSPAQLSVPTQQPPRGVSLPGGDVEAVTTGPAAPSGGPVTNQPASLAPIVGLLGPVPVLAPLIGAAVSSVGEAISWQTLGGAGLVVAVIIALVGFMRHRRTEPD